MLRVRLTAEDLPFIQPSNLAPALRMRRTSDTIPNVLFRPLSKEETGGMPRHAGTDQDLLAMALIGYEAQRAKITEAIRGIQAKLGRRGPGRPQAATVGAAPAKRVMSAAARRRIAAAQKKRWAAVRKSKAQGNGVAAPKKRRLSAAARKRIGDATRKRWAAVRKTAAKKTKPVAKAAVQKAGTAAS